MSKFVRSSKYRHVFGTPNKKENSYDNVKVTRSAWDSNKVKVNPKFVSICWEAGGGGSIAVIPVEVQGKLKPDFPLITGHKAPVLDMDFNPFNDYLIATGSEDAYVKVWAIPEGGLTENATEAAQVLQGHRRKVGTVDFHPTANNVLATSSTDLTVKLWDIEKGSELFNIGHHADIVQCVAWNYNGSLLATTCKDKKIRVFDPRTNEIVSEVDGHQGVKGSRACWLGRDNRLFTTGFGKTSERQYMVFDTTNMGTPLASTTIDNASGLLMPFYDADTGVLFLAGKGDGNIRYFEITEEKDYIYYLSEYKSNSPQVGMGYLPKRGVDVSTCEIARLYKATPSMVEPISFQVPRKSDMFQDDIFPDTSSGEPSLSAEEWASGKNEEPKLMSLAPGFQAPARPAATEFKPEKQVVDDGPKSENELRAEYEKLKTRVAYLEAELVKRDAKIKELEGK
jgi:WD40 repeat protein